MPPIDGRIDPLFDCLDNLCEFQRKASHSGFRDVCSGLHLSPSYPTPPAHSDVLPDELGRRPDDSGSSLMTFSAALTTTQRHTGAMLKPRHSDIFSCLLGHMEESSGQDVTHETRRRILRVHRLGGRGYPSQGLFGNPHTPSHVRHSRRALISTNCC